MPCFGSVLFDRARSNRFFSSPIDMLTVSPPEKRRKAKRNKLTNAKRYPEDRNHHFSWTVEVKKGEKDRLERLKDRLNQAKSRLRINRKTSSTQNADLLEHLLHCFDLVQPSVISARSSSVASTTSASSETVQPSTVPEQRRPQRRHIYVDGTVDDPHFICTVESLKALTKYFSGNPECEFCGGEYVWSEMTFSKQGHVCCMQVPCPCNDSVVWLSSGILGHPAKYIANVR